MKKISDVSENEDFEDFEEVSESKGRVRASSTGLYKVVIALLIIALGVVSYAYYKGYPLPFIKPNVQQQMTAQQQKEAEAKIAQYTAAASKLIILPKETPTVLTISDAATLSKEQAFYKGSQNGDVVFVFMEAKKAIIYSPSRNIVVNAGPVYLNDTATTTPTAKK